MPQVPHVVWTGNNIDEVEAFANKSDFGFVVGSNFHNFRWYHRLYDKLQIRVQFLPEWEPHEDMSVLEIYPERVEDDEDWHWTTARPGDMIISNGHVLNGVFNTDA